jgi:hypothetical protein
MKRKEERVWGMKMGKNSDPADLDGSLFNDAFSVTGLYSVDDRISVWWWIVKDLVEAIVT